MNDFARPSLYGAYHKILPLIKREHTETYHVVGPICETSCAFANDREMTKIEKGDYLAICDTGAYGHTMASQYNLRSIPQEYLL